MGMIGNMRSLQSRGEFVVFPGLPTVFDWREFAGPYRHVRTITTVRCEVVLSPADTRRMIFHRRDGVPTVSAPERRPGPWYVRGSAAARLSIHEHPF